MPHRNFVSLLASTLLLLCACQGYDIRVNDKVVYSPPPLFTAYDLPDPALRSCVEQAILDQSIIAPAQLQDLNCSHAGIAELTGLAVFSGLTRLQLSSNQIRNLVELGGLGNLRVLYLQDNRIVDPVPLYALSSLQELDLGGNSSLQCPREGAFTALEHVILPRHCLGEGASGEP
jgi:Leucine-rich repeat (LRR) protein